MHVCEVCEQPATVCVADAAESRTASLLAGEHMAYVHLHTTQQHYFCGDHARSPLIEPVKQPKTPVAAGG